MTEGVDITQALLRWIAERNPDRDPSSILDSTPLIAERLISSLQITELLLFIEELSGRRVEPSSLRPGVFRDVRSIREAFFAS